MNAISDDEAIDWLADPRPCLVMLGAGASVSAPACAPSAADIIRQSIDLLEAAAGVSDDSPRNPTGAYDWDRWPDVSAMSLTEALTFQRPGENPSRLDSRFRQRLLPESCYGAISSAYGTARHLLLWAALDTNGPKWPPGRRPRPNLGHYLSVELARRSALPVLTTNFDCFLEEAAKEMGLNLKLGLPSGRKFSARLASSSAVDEVAIWKLHGSAHDPQTVFSQAADLARGSYSALHRLFPMNPQRLVIAGYSGSDFDIFPWLHRQFRQADVLWVDKCFKPGHRAELLAGCKTWTGSVEDLASNFWDRQRPNSKTAAALDSARATTESDGEHIEKCFGARMAESISRNLGAVLNGSRGPQPSAERADRALFALALALATVGDFPQVAGLLDSRPAFLQSEPRAQLLQAFALASLDRHDQADQLAREILTRPTRRRDFYVTGRAQLMHSYASTIREIGTFSRYGISPNRVHALVAVAKMLVLGLRLAPLYVRARREGAMGPAQRARYDALEFGGDYAEHAVRIAAILSAAVASAPAIARKPIERTFLFVTDRLSFGVGYMRGLVNGYKYRARLAAPDDLADAIQSAALVGDAMAQAHAEREIADARATEDRKAAPGAGAQQDVLPHLLSALRWARIAGCPSLSLKTLLQARDLGILPDVVQGVDLQPQAQAMAESITGEADHRAARQLVQTLSAEPVSAEGSASLRRAGEQLTS